MRIEAPASDGIPALQPVVPQIAHNSFLLCQHKTTLQHKTTPSKPGLTTKSTEQQNACTDAVGSSLLPLLWVFHHCLLADAKPTGDTVVS